MTKTLELNKKYNREDVQKIFEPDYHFTKSTGTWGISGIIEIKRRPKDYVFFVSYGQSQGDHAFKEGIDLNGVLTWQSQPSNTLQTQKIQDFINHNETINNIYLFLDDSGKKPNGARQYTYMGKLAYLEHDPQTERPVHFKFQLIDQAPSPQIADNDQVKQSKQKPKISQTASRPLKANKNTAQFRIPKKVDYASVDAKNRELGLAGEELILQYEKDKLKSLGLHELATKVTHTSVILGDGAGYDISSFDENGNPLYIEVKTTKGGINTEFFISPNEAEFIRSNNSAVIYRLFNHGSEHQEFYVIDDLDDLFELQPTNFKAKIKS